MRALGLTIATAGFTGYAPIAPGTVGSLVGLLILFGVRASGNPRVELGVLVMVIVGGIWSAGVVERHAGIEDPGIVVVDEVAGMLLTLLWVPLTWPTGPGRLPGVPRVRHHQTLSSSEIRTASRRMGHHGRRPLCGGLCRGRRPADVVGDTDAGDTVTKYCVSQLRQRIDRPGIPARCVARRSNTPGILPHRALRSGRLRARERHHNRETQY